MLAAGASLQAFDAAPRIVPLHLSCANSDGYGVGIACLLCHAAPQRSFASLRRRNRPPQSAQIDWAVAGWPAAAPQVSGGSAAVCMAAKRP